MTIPSGWDLPAALRSQIGQGAGRQRALVDADNLLLVLHRVPKANQNEREGVLFWREPPAVAAPNGPLDSAPTFEWRSTAKNDGLPSMRLHLNEYERAIDALEKRYESADSARDLFEILEAIAPIGRAAKNLGNALQSALDQMPAVTELLPLREQAGDFERAAELLQTDAKNGLDYRIARGNEESARLANEAAKSGQRLNVIAAITLPITALSGVFGMNLPSGLENAPPILFWAIFGAGALFGVVLSLVVGRRG